MSVDPSKSRKILVVHGVQTGRDKDINAQELIKKLIINRLNGIPVDFDTEMYRYENINDKAQEKLRKTFDLFLSNLTKEISFAKLLGIAVDKGIDLVGDVVIKCRDGSTAKVICDGLIKKIEDIYEEGNPLYIVSHSLGSIYAFDAVNQLIKDERYFNRDSRRTWPVQALVTMGSPIGLSMFDRNVVEELGAGRKYFRWMNYWARTDPVVSGNFYGKPIEKYQIAEKFTTNSETSGWLIQDRVIDTGEAWLMAHIAYWNNADIGDDLITLITS